MSNFECCWKLKQCIGIRQSFNIINLNPLEQVTQNSLVNLSHELAEQLSDEPLMEILTEILQVSIHDNSGETLESCSQVSSVAPSLGNICKEPMSVSIQDSLQEQSQQALQVFQNEMLFQPETMEVSLQESSTNPHLELAWHPLIDACVNNVVGTPQDVCNNSILNKVLKPVNDASVQVQENKMSCEPMQVSNDLQLLLQQPFQNACQIGGKDVPSNVMPQSLTCKKPSATNNLPIELLNKSLEIFITAIVKYNILSGWTGRIWSTISICAFNNENRTKCRRQQEW